MSTAPTAEDGDGPLLAVHADGATAVGAGHLGRSLALAQAWRSGRGRAVLVPEPDDPSWADRYRAAGIEVAAAAAEADVVLVDSYRADEAALAALVPAFGTVPTAVVDDHGRSRLGRADLVVDQNLGAEDLPADRRIAPPGAVLAGARYALLRPEVVARRPDRAPDRAAAPRRLLVALGGSPPPAVRTLLEGAAALAQRDHGLELVPLAGVADVGAVLADVDLALTAAGSTVWELALLGIPTVAVATVDNQRPVARAVGAAGVAVDAGDLEHLDPPQLAARLAELVADAERRTALARAAWSAVDGRGARRAATAVRSLLVGLRRAGPDDAEQLWRWANDPTVRAASFGTDPIAWDDHVRWLDRELRDPRAAIWIAADHHGRALGQVRVDVDDAGDGLVDVSLAAERRGQGWAGPVLAAVARRAGQELAAAGLRRLRAQVLVDNAASNAAFAAADFDRGDDGSPGPRPHHTYTRACDG